MHTFLFFRKFCCIFVENIFCMSACVRAWVWVTSQPFIRKWIKYFIATQFRLSKIILFVIYLYLFLSVYYTRFFGIFAINLSLKNIFVCFDFFDCSDLISTRERFSCEKCVFVVVFFFRSFFYLMILNYYYATIIIYMAQLYQLVRIVRCLFVCVYALLGFCCGCWCCCCFNNFIFSLSLSQLIQSLLSPRSICFSLLLLSSTLPYSVDWNCLGEFHGCTSPDAQIE